MYLILDERETQLYDLCKTLIPTESTIVLLKQVLPLGDASIQLDATSKELVLFERKSIRDLLASIKDGRYEEQSHRLTHASQLPAHNIVYLIEGMYSQTRTAQEKQTVLSAITSLNLFKGFSVLRTCSLNETAEMMVAICSKIERDLKRGKTLFHISGGGNIIAKESLDNHVITDISGCEAGIPKESAILKYCEVVKKVKKDNITPQNIGEIILSQIPGISSVTAIAIMRHFISFPDFMDKIQPTPPAKRGKSVRPC
jgi:ERCC4-type nuclease